MLGTMYLAADAWQQNMQRYMCGIAATAGAWQQMLSSRCLAADGWQQMQRIARYAGA